MTRKLSFWGKEPSHFWKVPIWFSNVDESSRTNHRIPFIILTTVERPSQHHCSATPSPTILLNLCASIRQEMPVGYRSERLSSRVTWLTGLPSPKHKNDRRTVASHARRATPSELTVPVEDELSVVLSNSIISTDYSPISTLIWCRFRWWHVGRQWETSLENYYECCSLLEEWNESWKRIVARFWDMNWFSGLYV